MFTEGDHSEPYLLREVLEERDISPAFQVRAFERPELLELGLLRVFVEGFEETLMKDEVLVVLFVVYFDVGEVGMNTASKVGRERPRGRRPGQEGGFRIVNERECNSDYLSVRSGR